MGQSESVLPDVAFVNYVVTERRKVTHESSDHLSLWTEHTTSCLHYPNMGWLGIGWGSNRHVTSLRQ